MSLRLQSRIVGVAKHPVAAQDAVASNAIQTPFVTPQHRNNGINKVTAVVVTPIGSSAANAYGGFVENKHTFAYDPNLNLLVFTHRSGGTAGGGSKELSFDTSTDGGATWTPQQIVPNPSTTERHC